MYREEVLHISMNEPPYFNIQVTGLKVSDKPNTLLSDKPY